MPITGIGVAAVDPVASLVTALNSASAAPTGAPRVIGRKTYNPSTLAAVTTTSTSYSEVDTSNLAASFFVPANGSVMVRLVGYGQIATINEYIGWGVFSAGVLVSGSDAIVTRGSGGTDEQRSIHEVVITGLAPGASLTYTWAHKSQGGGTVKTTMGGVFGQVIMEILEVPTPSLATGIGGYSYTVGSAVTIRSAALIYASFPGMVRCNDGSLLAAWREGTTHTRGGDLYWARSTDQGATWTAQTLLAHSATEDYITATLSVLASGRVWLSSWYRAAGVGTNIPNSIRLWYSDDRGTTWTGPQSVTSGMAGFEATECPVLELTSGGNLLLAVFGAPSGTNGNTVKCLRSTNGGDTWSVLSTIIDGPAEGLSKLYNETGLSLVAGKLMATVREEANGRLMKATSTDSGATWSALSTAVPGCTGGPKVVTPSNLGGLQASVQRNVAGGYAQLVVTDSHAWPIEARIQPSSQTGTMMYGQVCQTSSGLGVFWAREISSTQSNLYFTPVVVAAV